MAILCGTPGQSAGHHFVYADSHFSSFGGVLFDRLNQIYLQHTLLQHGCFLFLFLSNRKGERQWQKKSIYILWPFGGC